MRIIPLSALLLSAGMAQPSLDLTRTEPPSNPMPTAASNFPPKPKSLTNSDGKVNHMNPYPAPAAP